MAQMVSGGQYRYVARSWAALIWISVRVAVRRVFGQRLVQSWPMDMEIANLFWRGQFIHAMGMQDMADGRAYFDSLQTLTDEVFDVSRQTVVVGGMACDWIVPDDPAGQTTVLYLHGGGYTFHAGITKRYGDMLAALLGVRLFTPDYRMTPEHCHPAQAVDALASYEYLLGQEISPSNIVVLGDSAGGHMALMLLQGLKAAGLPQPRLAVGLCPWTDIGDRGASMTGNDRYDLVQGWMAVQFGVWLTGDSGAEREELSPISHNYKGLAPLYLQGGGREVLIDMIRDFAAVVRDQECDVMLDVWPDMTHNFQGMGKTRPDSAEALGRLKTIVRGGGLTPCTRTEI